MICCSDLGRGMNYWCNLYFQADAEGSGLNWRDRRKHRQAKQNRKLSYSISSSSSSSSSISSSNYCESVDFKEVHSRKYAVLLAQIRSGHCRLFRIYQCLIDAMHPSTYRGSRLPGRVWCRWSATRAWRRPPSSHRTSSRWWPRSASDSARWRETRTPSSLLPQSTRTMQTKGLVLLQCIRNSCSNASIYLPAQRLGLHRWLQLRFDFDSTVVRLFIKGH